MTPWWLPWALSRRFDPAAAAGLDAVLELAVDGCPYALVIRDGRCQVRPGPAPEAAAGAAITRDDLIRLARGRARWSQLLSRGRLQLRGDPFLALRLPALFRLF